MRADHDRLVVVAALRRHLGCSRHREPVGAELGTDTIHTEYGAKWWTGSTMGTAVIAVTNSSSSLDCSSEEWVFDGWDSGGSKSTSAMPSRP
ncbi:MAG: hypothetical protein QOG20_3190 [Pseudonocardiales bacterium]|nr:hypothetical protein [Pseudonocardiales bacterium]